MSETERNPMPDPMSDNTFENLQRLVGDDSEVSKGLKLAFFPELIREVERLNIANGKLCLMLAKLRAEVGTGHP